MHHTCLFLLRLRKRGDGELRSQPGHRPGPPCFSQQTLTDAGDVEREPKEESVADQLREEQAQGELYYALQEREPSSPQRRGHRVRTNVPEPPVTWCHTRVFSSGLLSAPPGREGTGAAQCRRGCGVTGQLPGGCRHAAPWKTAAASSRRVCQEECCSDPPSGALGPELLSVGRRAAPGY